MKNEIKKYWGYYIIRKVGGKRITKPATYEECLGILNKIDKNNDLFEIVEVGKKKSYH